VSATRKRTKARPLIRLLRDPDPEGVLEVIVFSRDDEELCALSLAELKALVKAGAKFLEGR
jgi:hypothetical protein